MVALQVTMFASCFAKNRAVDIKGIVNHHVNNIRIGTTAGGVVTTQHGPVIVIMHQYAILSKGAFVSMKNQYMFLVENNKSKF